MRRYVACASEGNQHLIDLLESLGIDTQMQKYRIRIEDSIGNRYSELFKCPGDWLAYWSMAVQGQPSYENLKRTFGDDVDEEIRYVAEKNPTVELMADWAASSWAGGGTEDRIIYLKKTSGEILYVCPEDEDEYCDDASADR